MEQQGIGLNLGCGFRKISGFTNVDYDPTCHPDVLLDVNITPWPFADNSVKHLVAEHFFEHVGQTPAEWFSIWKEVYRICRPDAVIEISVPHPRSYNYLVDPTHVRPVLPDTLRMFDQNRNVEIYKQGGQESKLGTSLGIDFEIEGVHHILLDPWHSALERGEISWSQVEGDMMRLNNVCAEIRMKMRVHKPGRGAAWLKTMETLNQNYDR